MAFTNLSLIMLGGLFVAIPIVLHLIMRRQPRHLVFPALRFLRKKKEANQRRMRLRHWLLLLLRCAAIAVVAAALARPRSASHLMSNWLIIGTLGLFLLGVAALILVVAMQRRGPRLLVGLGMLAAVLLIVLTFVTASTLYAGKGMNIGDKESPVAAVFVFDTSPRMLYVSHNQTRLEKAQAMSIELLRQLPPDSIVGLVDSRPGSSARASSLSSAKDAIDALAIENVPCSLVSSADDALKLAVELAEQTGLQRKEIYLFTDGSAVAWEEKTINLQERLASVENCHLYLLDVGDESPRNFSMGPLELSPSTLTATDPWTVAGSVACVGEGGLQTVELHLEIPDSQLPKMVDHAPLLPSRDLREREELTLDADSSARFSFRLPAPGPGVHHGYVQLRGGDGLAIDDVRHFTITVQTAWPVLIVNGPGAYGQRFEDALAPETIRETGQARFLCDAIDQEQFSARSVDDYRAVCLLDPGPLSQRQWQALGDFVENGGGLAIFLGRNAEYIDPFNTDTAQRLLPGPLKERWPRRRDGARGLFLRNVPRGGGHPMLALFEGEHIPWEGMPIRWFWTFDSTDGATTLLSYDNGKAALLEKGVGAGRVVTMTTPLSDRLNDPHRPPWNYLPTADGNWPFMLLTNEILLYLVDAGAPTLNFEAGESVLLPLPAEHAPRSFSLWTPRGGWVDRPADDSGLSVPFASEIGHYRFKDNEGRQISLGFSLNLRENTTDLRRVASDRYVQLFGEDQFQLAREMDEVEIGVRETRVGREFYPYLIALLALILGLEHLLSNRFYRSAGEENAPIGNDKHANKEDSIPNEKEKNLSQPSTTPVV